MAENIGNQFWQILTYILIPVAAIIVTVTLWFKGRRRKDLSFLASCTAVLPKVEDTVGEKLKILFDGRWVRQIYLNTVTLLCSGNEPIRADDYEKPIEVNFGTDVRILSAEIVKPSKRCLEPAIIIERGSVHLTPILMNHGDRIDMKIITGSRPEKTAIRARIAGVDEIKAINRHERMSFWAAELGVGFLLATFVLVVPLTQGFTYFFGWQLVGFLILASVGISLIAISHFISGPKL
ncbi:MAG: hypothetical protein ABSB28_07680 [Candidatus Bathyarchaeia archaeon]